MTEAKIASYGALAGAVLALILARLGVVQSVSEFAALVPPVMILFAATAVIVFGD